MNRTVPAFAAATIVAGAIALLLTGFGTVEAHAPLAGKGDRADIVDCDRQSWPYYQHGCIRDQESNAGRAQHVRVVMVDRLDRAKGDNFVLPAQWSPSLIGPNSPMVWRPQ
ncbi:MAG: hypothetical protein AB7K04_11290 [Pseudorhodoplanes sp.]